ncbi:MAG: methionyl-tRNA formyltransferase [Chloroflexota bacterium]
MSIVFIGTPDFAVPSLRRLAADGHSIALVVTQPDRPSGRGQRLAPPPVKTAAESLGLTVIQPPTLRDEAVLNQLRALEPEAMVAVAYGQILRQALLDIAPRGVLNVHPSLLPKHRGASPIAGAILAGDDETGVSIMLMDAGMDSGPVLAQRRVPLSGDETTGALTASLAEVGADLLAETLPRWLAGEIEPQPQDGSQSTVTRLIKKEDGAIDWSLSAEEIARRVRAYNPWPGASTILNGETLHIWRAVSVAGSSGEPPGTIVVPPEAIDPALSVQAGDGLLEVHDLQRAGRKSLSATDFLRGMPRVIGQRLGA